MDRINDLRKQIEEREQIIASWEDYQLDVYNYLLDVVGFDEDEAYNIVDNCEYGLYDDFESFVYEAVEINGDNVPEFIEFDFVGMWLHTFAHYGNRYCFIDNLEFKKRPNCLYKDEPEYKRWEFDFYETIKRSRFLEIYN